MIKSITFNPTRNYQIIINRDIDTGVMTYSYDIENGDLFVTVISIAPDIVVHVVDEIPWTMVSGLEFEFRSMKIVYEHECNVLWIERDPRMVID